MTNSIFKTALGWAGVAATDRGICMIVLPRNDKKSVEQELANTECASHSRDALVDAGVNEMRNQGGKSDRIAEKSVQMLKKYFSGEQVRFDLPLDLRYYTPFQQSVWRAAAFIPFGETRSYQWIAKRIKRPLAARAVGGALGANPVPVIIPCHRVVTSGGRLGGFSDGLGMKKKLLELEKSTGR